MLVSSFSSREILCKYIKNSARVDHTLQYTAPVHTPFAYTTVSYVPISGFGRHHGFEITGFPCHFCIMIHVVMSILVGGKEAEGSA